MRSPAPASLSLPVSDQSEEAWKIIWSTRVTCCSKMKSSKLVAWTHEFWKPWNWVCNISAKRIYAHNSAQNANFFAQKRWWTPHKSYKLSVYGNTLRVYVKSIIIILSAFFFYLSAGTLFFCVRAQTGQLAWAKYRSTCFNKSIKILHFITFLFKFDNCAAYRKCIFFNAVICILTSHYTIKWIQNGIQIKVRI